MSTDSTNWHPASQNQMVKVHRELTSRSSQKPWKVTLPVSSVVVFATSIIIADVCGKTVKNKKIKKIKLFLFIFFCSFN